MQFPEHVHELKPEHYDIAGVPTFLHNVISQHSPAGNRYGIRYSELIAFMIEAM